MISQRNPFACLAVLLLTSLLVGTADGLSSPTPKIPATTTTTKTTTTTTDRKDFGSPPPETVEVLIAGGGLGGLAACIGLRNRGIDAHVIEASPRLLRGSTGTGIMISPNGFSALDSIAAAASSSDPGADLSGEMRRFGARISGQRVRVTDHGSGDVTKEFKMGGYADKYGIDQYNIGWAKAHEVLAGAVPHGAVHTGCKLESFEAVEDEVTGKKDGAVLVRLEDGRTIRASLLVGADGFGSRVRQLLAGEKKCQTKFNGQLLWNAIMPTDQLPAGLLPGKGQVEFINCGSGGQAVLAFDSGEGQTAWYLMLMEEDAPEIIVNAIREGKFGGFGPQPGVKSALTEAFDKWPIALQCLEATPENKIFERRQADRPRLMKWSNRSRGKGAGGRVVLMGDAAHPMIPSLGQGTMVTWEDAAELASFLAPLSNDGGFEAPGVPKAVRKFVRRRAKRCAMVQQMSRESRMGKPLPKFLPLKIRVMMRMKRTNKGIYGYKSSGDDSPPSL